MNEKASPSTRLASLDWMRGFVMVLMTIDHASLAFNGSRLSADSAGLYVLGLSYSAAEFLTRWSTHLCAPTFVFLAGTALALSTERRIAKGGSEKEIDNNLLKRGAIIAALDPTLISLLKGHLTFQVLFAIGSSMMLMAVLRKLPPIWLFILAFAWVLGGEAITLLFWTPTDGWPDALTSILFVTLYSEDLQINYPIIPWLSLMMLGWVFGQYLTRYLSGAKRVVPPVRLLVITAFFCFTLFALFRWLNDYGNMMLVRESNHWIHWLYVSKYPPSLIFILLELGLLAICLAAFMLIEKHVSIRPNGPLLVFGQTALFFYILHRIILDGSAALFDLHGFGGLTETFIISVAVLLILYPACIWFRNYKRLHPLSWVRYI
jgi:uncharacterized membrane protein